jgi:hypothetical protein
MPTTPWIAMTGEQNYPIEQELGFVPMSASVYLASTTNPRVRLIGTTLPRFVQFGGSFSFYSRLTLGGVPRWFVGGQTPLNREGLIELYRDIDDKGLVFMGINWRIPPATTWQISLTYHY